MKPKSVSAIPYLHKLLAENPRSLYLIIDVEICARMQVQPADIYKIAFDEGIRIFQYRNKKRNSDVFESDAGNFYTLVRDHDKNNCALPILNDNLDLSIKWSLPVHLGQSDLPERLSKSQKDHMNLYGYGASSHNLAELEYLNKFRAIGLGPTYTAFGAIFDSPTKPDVKNALRLLPEFFLHNPSVYSVMIGGLSVKNLEFLVEHLRYAHRDSNVFYAVISGIFENGHSVKQIQETIRAYQRILQWPVP